MRSAWVRWWPGGLVGCWLGQGPGCLVAVQAEGEEAAEVECGGSGVEPGVVLGGAAVAQAAVAAGEPGDGAFDHGPVLPVQGLEGGVCGAGAVGAGERVVVAEFQAASGAAGGAAGAERAAAAGGAEADLAAAGDRTGVSGRAGRGPGGFIDGELVDGESARDRRTDRPRLDDRFVSGGGQVPGAVGG